MSEANTEWCLGTQPAVWGDNGWLAGGGGLGRDLGDEWYRGEGRVRECWGRSLGAWTCLVSRRRVRQRFRGC